jgi:hypothetical protein
LVKDLFDVPEEPIKGEGRWHPKAAVRTPSADVGPSLATVQTPEGDTVVLTATAWAHIADEHPDIAPFRDEVLETIAEPDAVADDPRPGRQRFYRHGIGPSRWLRVIVDFNQSPARVVTAFGFRKEHPA